jgi:REase_DpnII-MboI
MTSKDLDSSRISEVIGSICDSLSKANQIAAEWEFRERDHDDVETVNFHVENAFVQALVLVEAAGLNETLKSLQALHKTARADYSKSTYFDGIFLVWAERLQHYLDAFAIVFGEPHSKTVTKDIVEILRAAQYSITDRSCFLDLPGDEAAVHVRIEAVLRCVFPDLIRKPAITKPIKNFEPDTGIPSLKTLIEYKFISNSSDAKCVSDEILADTRGYVSPEWNRFIYVIYETRRIKSEKQWIQHLRECEVGPNTGVVVR